MVEYLSGNRIQGSSTLTSSPPATSWKILGRAAVASGDDIDVTVTAKDNMMILQHLVPSGQIDQGLHFNDDGGAGSSSNYAWRTRRDGSAGATAQGTSTYRINTEELYPNTAFEVFNMQHTNGQEKITQSNVVMATTTGSGTAPSRTEGVGKWNGTGNVTKVSFTNIDSGDYGSGSEVVVLGCDNDEANSGTNAWQQLGKTTLTAESDDLEVSFTAKKYLMVQANCLHTGTIDTNITFNGSASGYAERSSNNGDDDAVAINRSWIATGGDPADSLHEYFIINNATKEKLLIGHKVDGNTSSTAPQRKEFVAKWTNATDQITTIKLNNATSGAGFITGSSITVWGFD